MICQIWVRSFAYVLWTFHISDAAGLLYISRERFSSRTKSSLKKGGSYRKTNSVPSNEKQRSMHACHFIDPLMNGRGRFIRACKWHFAFAESDGARTLPPFPRFAASRWFTSSIPRRILPILGSAARAFASFDTPCCRSTVWSSLFLPNFDVPGERLAYRKRRLFAASTCNWTCAVSRMEGYNVEKNREGKENLENRFNVMAGVKYSKRGDRFK